jgi:hypothetical protein
LTVSGLAAGVSRRFRYPIGNNPLFPDVYAKSGKWFRRAAELFRRSWSDETIGRKESDISLS